MNITGKTQLLGLFGWPVSHTFSPAMHNAALAAAQLDYVYLPLAVEPSRLRAAIAGLTAMGFKGVNVTLPHKQAVMAYLDGISEAADAIGAVNTIERGEYGLIGHNTDWSGFSADLDTLGVEVAGRDCIVIGSGGSARAITYALLKRQANVHIYARRIDAADDIVSSFAPWFDAPIHTHALAELDNLSTDNALLINTTPLGMTPKVAQSIWPENRPIAPSAFVYDLVYTPAETKLMRQARQSGAQAANGLGMLLQQGAHAFKLWTGVEPDLGVMSGALPFTAADDGSGH